MKFNKDHLERARTRFPEAFAPPPPGIMETPMIPIRQTGYTWVPRGEVDEQGHPVHAGLDRMAREIMGK